MNWENLDWKALQRIRSNFLHHPDSCVWGSMAELEAYELTFAQRIGWKWDAVLKELGQRGWTPPSDSIVDWGCGSGIASRRFIEFFEVQNFTTLSLWDHSTLACEFSRNRAIQDLPSLEVKVESLRTLRKAVESSVLLLSHVLNEMSEEARSQLCDLLSHAKAVVWVEPGTFKISRDLSGLRDQFLDEFRVVAPCTHQSSCGLLAPENQKHWCHHFAESPSHIFRDREWQRFSRELGIDLRSLPYSFLVLEKKGLSQKEPQPGFSRIIGEPRQYKGYSKVLSCQSAGVEDLMLQKRDDPELFRAIKKHEASSIQRWKRDGAKIIGSDEFARQE